MKNKNITLDKKKLRKRDNRLGGDITLNKHVLAHLGIEKVDGQMLTISVVKGINNAVVISFDEN